MGIELTTRNIGTKEIYYDNFVEQGVDCDITLPDYCPDIMRIIKCSVSSCVTSSKLTGDRAAADGNAKIRLIYTDEKNNVYCYDQDYPFSKYAELNSSFEGAELCCTSKTEYVNCRAVSKRRVDVHGVVGVHFKVMGCKNIQLISDACGEGVQLKRKGLDIEDVAAVVTKNFELSQVENVGDSNAGIGKVLDVFASATVNENKIIKGKILLKGELYVRVVYCSDSADNETCTLCCNIPFNEIAEASAVTDDCKLQVETCVNSISAEPKTDNDGEYRYMNINAEISVGITAYKKQSVRVITDAYSTDAELDAKYGTVEFLKLCDEVREKLMCRQTLDVSAMKPKRIYSSALSTPECKCRVHKDKLTFSGKIPLSITVVDEEGTPVVCEREAEFSLERPVDDGTQLICSPQVSLGGCSVTLTGDGKADFKAEVFVNSLVFSTAQEKVMTALEVQEGAEKRAKKSAVVLCFCSGGESVWDIARKYNTTVEDIMQENELTSDLVENKRMLLIPVK